MGEAAGDRLNFFAEGQPITLPNSGAMVLMATERHDYVTGGKGYTDCHGQVVEFPIAAETLEPEVKAPWSDRGHGRLAERASASARENALFTAPSRTAKTTRSSEATRGNSRASVRMTTSAARSTGKA